jgi:response regulator NasT
VADRPATRIVVAEDEAIIRMDLVELLAEEGYDVVADVGRGDLAVEAVRTHRPDAAIFDVKMPGIDGVEAVRVLAPERICPVIMLTAFSQREVIEQARDAGALAYLVKPFQRTDLVPAIELAIGRFEEVLALTGERDDLASRLEVRKLVDRAKGILMDRRGMSEQDAYGFLQRRAMEGRTTMADVSRAVIDDRLDR